MNLNTLFSDKDLKVEPLMFQFSKDMKITIHKDGEYKVSKAVED